MHCGKGRVVWTRPGRACILLLLIFLWLWKSAMWLLRDHVTTRKLEPESSYVPGRKRK